MNTPRQANARPGIARIPGRTREGNVDGRASVSFVAPYSAGSSPTPVETVAEVMSDPLPPDAAPVTDR